MAKIALWVFVLLLCAPACASAGDVEQGRYLATLGDCESCHTAPDKPSRPYAGGYALHAYFGTVYSANITPDAATGIGTWSKDQFYRAMHEGIAANGHRLYPAFPYIYFTKVSRADSDALYDYLRTVRPIRNTPPPNRLVFPADIRFGMAFWDWLYLDTSPLKSDASKSAQWNRGAEIVNGLGHCGGCHSAKTVLFADASDGYLRGARLDGWSAPNLTGSRRTGLGAWSAADIEGFLKSGNSRFGRAVGAMQDVIRVSTSRLTDGDRAAIATYLKSLPASPEPHPSRPQDAAMQQGQAVFVERCSVCHGQDRKSYPPLAGNSIVRQSDPTTLLRVILQGSQSVPTRGTPIGFSMPAFPTLSNADLAAVATYIRNSWGNSAGPVSQDGAARLRALLGHDAQ